MLFCFYMLRSSAQVIEAHRQRFGIKAGITYNLMNFNAGSPAPVTAVKNSWKPGIYAGGSLQFQLDETFSIQPEYLYNFMQGADDRIKAGYKLHYLSLPVLLKIALAKRLAVVAGPEFSLLIRAAENAVDVTHNTEERSISAVGGIELNITPSLCLNARFVHGLNHIGLGQRSAVKEFKWRGVGVGFGWRW